MKGAVVLISGRGSNLRALLDHPRTGGQIRAVVSDNPAAPGLAFARERGVPVVCVSPADFSRRADFEAALADSIDRFSPRVVALAGFMRILGGDFVRRYAGRLVNIHPSLLPNFRGLDTHRRALAARALIHGCTAHLVAEEVDGGEIIAREEVKVSPDDDERSLAARVLAREHILYPRVVADLLAR